MIFLNIWKKLVQQCESRVAEGQEQFEQWRISAQSMTLFSVRKTHLRHIEPHDCERNGHPSFICCTNNSRWVTSEMRQETPCTGAETEVNCITRSNCVKKLLSKFPKSAVDLIFFTDEKVFTVALPVNLQNDRVYAPRGKRSATLPPIACFSLSQHSASLSWCLSRSQNLATLKRYLWSREWR